MCVCFISPATSILKHKAADSNIVGIWFFYNVPEMVPVVYCIGILFYIWLDSICSVSDSGFQETAAVFTHTHTVTLNVSIYPWISLLLLIYVFSVTLTLILGCTKSNNLVMLDGLFASRGQ